MPLPGPAAAPVAPPGPSAEHDHAAHGTKGQHDRHEGHSVGMFWRRFWVSLALTLPIVAFGHMVPSLFGWSSLTFPGSAYLPPVLGTVVFAYGGWTFIPGKKGPPRLGTCSLRLAESP